MPRAGRRRPSAVLPERTWPPAYLRAEKLPTRIDGARGNLDIMRSRMTMLIICALDLGAAAAQTLAAADRPRRCVGPDGRIAEVRVRPKGGEAVWIDGRLGWPEATARATPRITSPLVWSRSG